MLCCEYCGTKGDWDQFHQFVNFALCIFCTYRIRTGRAQLDKYDQLMAATKKDPLTDTVTTSLQKATIGTGGVGVNELLNSFGGLGL